MRPDELPAKLARQLAPLYLIHGEEQLLALEAAQLIREHALAAGYSERTVLTVETGFDWSQLGLVGNSFSLFSQQQLIDLRIPSGKPGVEGGKALEAYAANLAPDTLTLVQLPKLDRTTQGSKWFTALAAAGEVIDARTVERHELPAWINQRLGRQQQHLGEDALAWLVDHIEGNLLAAHQEIQKLGLLHPPGEISLDTLKAAISNVARYDVFELGTALLAGDAPRCLRMLEGLEAEGEASHLVLWALVEEIRTLYRIGKARAEGRPLPTLLKENRVWGEKQRLIGPALERISGNRLRQALARAPYIDQLNKGIGQGEVWDELRNMILPLLDPIT